MKKLCILISTLLLSHSIFAQSGHTFDFRVGLAKHNFQDKNYSALAYSGSNLTYGLTYKKESGKSQFAIDFEVQNASLSSNLDESKTLFPSLQRTSYQGNISYLRQISVPRLEVKVGGSSTTFYDFVPFPFSANNLVSYELTTSLNGAVEVVYLFTQNLNYRLKADIPMLTLSVRPQDYGLFHMKNLEFDLGRALKSATFYPTNKIFFLHFNHMIEYEYKGRKIGLFYDYIGGYNKALGKKGSAIQKVGISIPLFTKS